MRGAIRERNSRRTLDDGVRQQWLVHAAVK